MWPSCLYDGCGRPSEYQRRSYCRGHREQLRKGRGLTDLSGRETAEDVLERFMEKVTVNPDTGCWDWSGKRASNGYSAFCLKRQWLLAHRLAYTFHVGELADSQRVEHSCGDRYCVNPHHLRLLPEESRLTALLKQHHLYDEVADLRRRLRSRTAVQS